MNKYAIPYHSLRRSVYKESYVEFIKEFWDVISNDVLVMSPHVEVIANEIQEVLERLIRWQKKEYDLIINVPPGSTKSTCASVMLVPYLWPRMPHAQVLNCSFEHGLSLDLALKSRSILDSDKYRELFPEIVPSKDQWTKSYFKNSKNGYRFATSTRGSVTGRHGHLLISDDSIDPEGTYSKTDLKAINRWLKQTFGQRKVDKSKTPIICIQQRLHQEDETGWRLEQSKKIGGTPVRHICFPAIKTKDVNPPENNALYNAEGLLDPIRLPISVLKAAEVELGAYGYAGQFLQSPNPLEGGIFKVTKMLSDFPPLHKIKKICRFWDKAGTEDDGAYTVGLKLGFEPYGKDPATKQELFRVWFLDVVRGQWGADERETQILFTARADGKKVMIGLEQEPGSGGKESTESTVRRLIGYNVIVLNPSAEGDKVRRAGPLATQVNWGNVRIMAEVEWKDALIDEFRFFPSGKYKDQVDAASGAFICLTKRMPKAGMFG